MKEAVGYTPRAMGTFLLGFRLILDCLNTSCISCALNCNSCRKSIHYRGSKLDMTNWLRQDIVCLIGILCRNHTCRCLSRRLPINSSSSVYASDPPGLLFTPKYPDTRRIPNRIKAIVDLHKKSSGQRWSSRPTRDMICKYLSLALFVPISSDRIVDFRSRKNDRGLEVIMRSASRARELQPRPAKTS